MTLPAWPNTLPQRVLRDGYSRKDAVRRLSSEMDDGTEVDRLPSTISAYIDTVSFDMNATQHAAWETFYLTTISRGTLRFTMPTVNANATYTDRTVKMIGEKPQEEYLGGGWWRVSFEIKVHL